MNRVKPFFLVRLVLAAVLPAALQGCASNRELTVEKPIATATPQPTPAGSSAAPSRLPPPTRAQVKEAFQRVFGESLVAKVDDAGGLTTFIVGDFNGDQSEDLAVIAQPAPGKLDDVNNELSNWILQDADKAFLPTPAKSVVVPPHQARPRVERGEELLAIIHGVGPQGWRNPEARQAYIVKHAAARLEGTAPSISQKAVRAMHLPVETEIIKEVRNNKKGFLFWTGGVYAWHPSEG
ncbi:MAG TPA: hypothetical protein VLA83_06100 [Candidatus Binatia bacterium]|nr:hypothetical protein [Candidatus Binatia bacterium]